jgi:5'-deoxynucleotidase YfbR-like HD superfamily hydrolase
MNLAKFFGLSSGLAGTQRFSNANLIHHESVLEHIGQVCLCCYFICHEINASPELQAQVMMKAAIHDVEEVLTGDIPRPIKYASSQTQEAFSILSEEAMRSIIDSLELCDPIKVNEDHVYAKMFKSGKIVEIADVLAVIYKVHHEVIDRGNRSMMSRATTCMDHLDSLFREINLDHNHDLKWTEPECKTLNLIFVQGRTILKEAMKVAGKTSSIEEKVLSTNSLTTIPSFTAAS